MVWQYEKNVLNSSGNKCPSRSTRSSKIESNGTPFRAVETPIPCDFIARAVKRFFV